MRHSPFCFLAPSAGVRVSSFLLACVALAGFGSVAAAQTPATSSPRGEFSVMGFTPSPGANNYFQLDGAAVRGEFEGFAGVTLDYAHEPFSLYSAQCDAMGGNCEATGRESQIVSYLAAAHLYGGVALFHRLQISLTAPLVYTEGQAFANPTGPGDLLTGGSAFTVGDLRLHLKGNILDDSSGLRLGVAAWVTAPIAQQIAPGRYVGDEQPSFGGHGIVEFVQSGFHIAGNIGGVWRDGDTLFSTVAGPQMTYGLALGYEITPVVYILGEVVGATAFSGQVDENPLEGRLGGRIRIDDVQIDLAGGVGIMAGVGVPAFRVLGGFQWAPQRADTDGDGIHDNLDGCPTEAEDMDGWHDEDGCPEADNDDDGILDRDDNCPDEAEDMDGEEDTDGCPENDDDGDGINDGYDSCPHEPEDFDGDRDEDGCPDNDRDRDHIEDDVDQCPDEPEDTDGFGDEDGCPEVDFDNDTIPDDQDQCPDQAEDADGFEDEDGCPEEGGPPAAEETPESGRRRRGR